MFLSHVIKMELNTFFSLQPHLAMVLLSYHIHKSAKFKWKYTNYMGLDMTMCAQPAPKRLILGLYQTSGKTCSFSALEGG